MFTPNGLGGSAVTIWSPDFKSVGLPVDGDINWMDLIMFFSRSIYFNSHTYSPQPNGRFYLSDR